MITNEEFNQVLNIIKKLTVEERVEFENAMSNEIRHINHDEMASTEYQSYIKKIFDEMTNDGLTYGYRGTENHNVPEKYISELNRLHDIDITARPKTTQKHPSVYGNNWTVRYVMDSIKGPNRITRNYKFIDNET